MGLRLILFLVLFVFSTSETSACFSITDDLNFVNPTLSANFDLLPDVSPFTDCWNSSIKIRSDKNGWRLIATRVGPEPISVIGNSSENIKAEDIELTYSVTSFGMADNDGAILVSPFGYETKLSSVGYGTLVVSGIKKSGNSCSAFNVSYYKITQKFCLFRDFVFNPGQYSGQISYLLIAP